MLTSVQTCSSVLHTIVEFYILFCSILDWPFHSILSWPGLICSICFCSVPFWSVLFHLFLFCSTLAYSVPACHHLVQPSFVLFHSVLVHSFVFSSLFSPVPSYSFWFYSITFCSNSFPLLSSESFNLILTYSISFYPSAPSRFSEYLLSAQYFDRNLWHYKRRKYHPMHELVPLRGEWMEKRGEMAIGI